VQRTDSEHQLKLWLMAKSATARIAFKFVYYRETEVKDTPTFSRALLDFLRLIFFARSLAWLRRCYGLSVNCFVIILG
jgi:hypothetical protein